MIIISLILTVIAGGLSIYAFYITSQVAGDKLLMIDSVLGYRYATTYRMWQLIAGIAVVITVLFWLLTILIKIRKHKKKNEI